MITPVVPSFYTPREHARRKRQLATLFQGARATRPYWRGPAVAMVPWCTVVVLAGLGLVGAKNALLPELSTSPREPDPPMSCNGEDMEACFGKQMAKAIPAQFLCNVSKLPPAVKTLPPLAVAAPRSPWQHPALDPHNYKDLLLPANTHLLLYGESHMRSVRHVLLAAAKLFNRPVDSSYISLSDDCDEQPRGFTGRAYEQSGASTETCGLFSEDHTCKNADLIRDVFVREGGNSSITMVANHMQYLLPASPLDPPEPKHTEALEELLGSYPFTHAHFQFPHFRKYFDAHCEYRKGGPAPDPRKIGDGVETFCDLTKPACMGTSPLYAVIKRHIPKVSFLGGVNLRHGLSDKNTSCSRIHDTYEHDIVEDFPSHYSHDGKLVHVHACNAICSHGENASGLPLYGDTSCRPAEGVVVAWEVLRSAGLLTCPREWTSCDPIEIQPLWVLGARDGAGESNVSCPAGERNAVKSECYSATVEAVGKDMVTGPLLEVHADRYSYPSGCSYGRADKRAIYNDSPVSTDMAKGHPLVCTHTVHQSPILRKEQSPMRTMPSDAQAADIAASIAEEIAHGWRRAPSTL